MRRQALPRLENYGRKIVLPEQGRAGDENDELLKNGLNKIMMDNYQFTVIFKEKIDNYSVCVY